MKRLLSIAALLCVLVHAGYTQGNKTGNHGLPQPGASSSRSMPVFNYDLTTFVTTYIELNPALAMSINNGEVWDQPTYEVPMEFPFELNGHAVTTWHFNGSGSSIASNTQVPFEVAEIFPFESDLIDRGTIGGTSLSPISYIVEGVPGSRIQKFEFKNAGSYYEYDVQGTLNMFVNFQFWLFEGSNNIELHFGSSSVGVPILFYGGGTGPKCGVTDYDEFMNQYSSTLYVVGAPASPFLSEEVGYLNGTPGNGTVYRLTYLPPLNINVTGANGNSYCQPNGSAQVTANGGVTPYTYSWSNGEITSSIDSLDAGVYAITVTDDEGSTATGSITIDNAAPMTVNINSTDETAVGANDGTAAALPSEGTSPYAFNWSNGATTPAISNLAPGTYDVTVTDAAGCTQGQSVLINAFMCDSLILFYYVVDVTCNGACNGTINVFQVEQGNAPFLFTWSNGEMTSLIDSLCAGNYGLTVTDNNGCVVSQNFTVIQPDSLLVIAQSTNESGPNANNGTAWAITSGGTYPYSFVWSNGSTDSLMVNLSPGVYSVTVTDVYGCTTVSQNVVVTAFCPGYMESSVQNNGCADTCQWTVTGFIVEGGPGPFSYEWSTGDTSQVSLDSLCPGTYSVTVIDHSNLCHYVAGYLITQPEPIVAVVDTVIHLTDSTSTAIAITVISGPPPYNFSWYGPNGFIGNDEDLAGVPPGFYSVQVYNTLGNCGEIDSIEVLDLSTGITPVSDWNLQVFPNPADAYVYVRGIEAEEFMIQLFQADGRELKNWKNLITLDVQDIQPGWYVLKITADRSSVSKPLFILR